MNYYNNNTIFRKNLLFLLILVFFLSITNPIFAHPGRTDSSGCHTCRTNCEKWGLSYGEYHCHNSKSISVPIPTPIPAPSPAPIQIPTPKKTEPSVKKPVLIEDRLTKESKTGTSTPIVLDNSFKKEELLQGNVSAGQSDWAFSWWWILVIFILIYSFYKLLRKNK